MIEIHVRPQRSMVDEPLEIHLTGLQPQQQVTLHAAQTDDHQRTWRSHATSAADSTGQIDVARQTPVSGTYADTDALALIWSMELPADEPNQGPFFHAVPTPLPIEF